MTSVHQKHLKKYSCIDTCGSHSGGIKLKHEVTSIRFSVGHDENKEIPVIKKVNALVMETMKQCWRLKHHPLIQKEDLFQLLPGTAQFINTLSWAGFYLFLADLIYLDTAIFPARGLTRNLEASRLLGESKL